MKTSKLLTLDVEIVEELQKLPNASGLINEMLLDYFNKSGHLKKQELQNKLIFTEAEIKRLNNDLEIIKEQIEKIEADEKRVKDIFKNIPREIMDDFSFFDKMTLETLFNRYQQVYSRKFNIEWEEVKKAYCELKGIKEEKKENE